MRAKRPASHFGRSNGSVRLSLRTLVDHSHNLVLNAGRPRCGFIAIAPLFFVSSLRGHAARNHALPAAIIA
jgi:hypothetical protein